MEDRYFFDKRVMKKILIKYGIMFLCLFPVLIIVNYFLNKVLHYWVTIIIDITIVLFVVFSVELIISSIKKKKELSENDLIIKKVKEIKAKRTVSVGGDSKKNKHKSNNLNNSEEIIVVDEKTNDNKPKEKAKGNDKEGQN